MHAVIELDPTCFSSDCPSRGLFDQIADKWSAMVLVVLSGKPHRFNLIRRRLEGVSQKALTQCLRRLERNGLITRRVVSLSPVAVEYEITALGRTLQKPLGELHQWTLDNLSDVNAAREAFDARQSDDAFGGVQLGKRSD
ncbi:winged helix-turn-helix transcriptional regulator [Sphingomonas psychrotolerans]|uniref:Transcriptional regulator n=1 Tax=Sphingomonas psychrotolerans TaxID=1327635 RepID=A0A2K8MA20_9SPHN|nr:helix-turn-helix domain-containing protein [Sphingomonas psychrotolerans]ATY30732.1 transcriptional regulator [Sphingomonas psychrotolerans]